MVEQVGGYEKLGSFYLGEEDDTEKSEVTEDLLLYNSKDLVTQGGGARRRFPSWKRRLMLHE
jgi:hypothetical protein